MQRRLFQAGGERLMTTIAPMLSVRCGASAVEFYKQAFHADEQFRIESPTGEVVVRLRVGDCEFWVADESPAHRNFSPETMLLAYFLWRVLFLLR
jgi:PhnB protein